MPVLPPEIMILLLNFAPLFTTRTWQYVPVLGFHAQTAGFFALSVETRM